jgi:hypothetical protein
MRDEIPAGIEESRVGPRDERQRTGENCQFVVPGQKLPVACLQEIADPASV